MNIRGVKGKEREGRKKERKWQIKLVHLGQLYSRVANCCIMNIIWAKQRNCWWIVEIFTQLALYVWQANAERLLIEGQSAIENARLKAEAEEIIHSSELEIQTEMRHSELAYVKESNNLEISKAQQLSDIEVNKWRQLLDMCILWWIIVYNLTF